MAAGENMCVRGMDRLVMDVRAVAACLRSRADEDLIVAHGERVLVGGLYEWRQLRGRGREVREYQRAQGMCYEK